MKKPSVENFVRSSANPDKVSLTVKGALVALVPFTVVTLQYLGLDVTQNDLMQLVNAIATTVASAMVLYGAGRKVYYKAVR